MLSYILVAFITSLIAVIWIHPIIVKIALDKNIVDNPNKRKLQSHPIPVLGGVAVFFGIIIGLAFTSKQSESLSLMPIIAAMLIMLYTGVIDDIINLSARKRLLMEIGVIALLIFTNDLTIDNFHGLWGLHEIPRGVAIPLTIFAAVGIINSINLIDGVDGLCSCYGMFASMLFGIIFMRMGDVSYAVLAFTIFGALRPFMLHNVFGKKYKMFMGDGGSLVLGFVLALFVTRVIQSGADVVSGSTISFTLAILAIPVFDTLRVMTSRMLQGRSPFSPDKTHLHHMFIELGFSHVITAFNVILLNGLVVAIWYMCSLLEFSAEMQLYVVVASGLMFTTGLYHGVQAIQKHSPASYLSMQRLVKKHAIHRSGLLLYLQKVLDR